MGMLYFLLLPFFLFWAVCASFVAAISTFFITLGTIIQEYAERARKS